MLFFNLLLIARFLLSAKTIVLVILCFPKYLIFQIFYTCFTSGIRGADFIALKMSEFVNILECSLPPPPPHGDLNGKIGKFSVKKTTTKKIY